MNKWRRFCKKALEIELIVGGVIAVIASCAVLIPVSAVLCVVEFITDRRRKSILA